MQDRSRRLLPLLALALPRRTAADPPMAWFDPPQYNGPTEQALLSSLNATLDAIVAEGNSIDTLWMDTLMGQTGITLLQSAAQRGYANLTATLHRALP